MRSCTRRDDALHAAPAGLANDSASRHFGKKLWLSISRNVDTLTLHALAALALNLTRTDLVGPRPFSGFKEADTNPLFSFSYVRNASQTTAAVFTHA